MKYIYRFSALSTNTSIAHYDFIEPFILYTFRQTAGKGMGTNSWFTGHGKNIALSLCLHPAFLKPEEQFLLNIALSSALRNALQTLICNYTAANTPQVSLKWPNDIYVDDKKLAGILFENKISGCNNELCSFSKSITGIGLNVNQKKFPLSLPNPTSLYIITKRKFCKKNIVHTIGSALENAYNNLAEGIAKNGYEYVWNECKKEYLSSLLYYGKERNFIYKDKPITGKIVNVDNFGRLIISVKDSEPLVCDIKDVKFFE
ncbi:MAG: biotin--[acetyl-CoA-carboxylase] ligase [Bacteroidales bacterium]|jgi:BirA family biotin operon repressor/biotin-[acetyl-CoA-carboxylase] ligase|nr:biotin--[acetyl-CoA-carboxylase] ligase [Bacteroidales bacterium]